MSTLNFSNKYITVIIGIGSGITGSDDPLPGTLYTLEGHRISAEINAFGGATQGEASVQIYGLNPSLMNALTAIGPVMIQRRSKNTIQILAGTNPNALSTIYNGIIETAYADYNTAPDVVFSIMARGATVAALRPAHDYTKAGVVKVSEIMATIAAALTWEFINLDIDDSFVVHDPHYQGSLWNQIQQCAADSRIIAVPDVKDSVRVLKIKQLYSVFNDAVTILSPTTNLIGYPTFSAGYTKFKMLFTSTVNLGTRIQVQGSAIKAANRGWLVNKVTHDIESLVVNGKWYTYCEGMPDDLSVENAPT